MKKIMGLALLTIALNADPNDQALPPDQPIMNTESAQPVSPWDEYGSFALTDFRMGYFRFSDKSLRHIYDKGVLDLQLVSSFCVWTPLYIYLAGEYIGAKGRSIGGHDRTKVRIVPISLGLQYIQPITYDFRYYLTLGPRVFYFHQKNHGPGVPSQINKWGCGGFVNTGFMYYLSEHIIVDFYGEYSYKRMHFETHKAATSGGHLQIGGLTLGGGIGYFW
jgi:outer membrane protein